VSVARVEVNVELDLGEASSPWASELAKLIVSYEHTNKVKGGNADQKRPFVLGQALQECHHEQAVSAGA
jgi:hypothetical protein